jgi:hypothetical protein
MKEIASCCEGDYRVGPAPKDNIQEPDFVVIVTSKQHEYQKSIDQEKSNGNQDPMAK